MSDNAFVDTNILVYARDKGAGEKHIRAQRLISELWAKRTGRVSIQVLNEYFVTVTQKLKPGMSAKDAWADLESLRAWNPVAIEWKLLEHAQVLFRKHKLSWWDALVLAAAQITDCAILYSEDLADGEVYGGVRVVNPFARS